jgi:hypothetical protein
VLRRVRDLEQIVVAVDDDHASTLHEREAIPGLVARQLDLVSETRDAQLQQAR